MASGKYIRRVSRSIVSAIVRGKRSGEFNRETVSFLGVGGDASVFSCGTGAGERVVQTVVIYARAGIGKDAGRLGDFDEFENDGKSVIAIYELKQQGIVLDVDAVAKKYLADKGYNVMFGVRPLKRFINDEIMDEVAMRIIEGKIKDGDRVKVSGGGKGLIIK